MQARDTVTPGDRTQSTASGFDAVVRGRVQGIGYRFYVLERARALKLGGYVSNLPDGAVHVVASGERVALEQLLADIRKGPFLARVDDIALTWGLPAAESPGEFCIRI